jgi:hypothetical protein
MVKRSRGNSDGLYNFITVLALIGTLVVVFGTGAFIAVTPPPTPSPLELTQVAELLIRTNTPTSTFTPSATFTPSQTPTFTLTPTATESPTATQTPTFTAAPSATITDTPAPTLTPSITPTPRNTDTPTPTATPTGPTATFTPSEIPFLFGLREGALYTRNFANSAGCSWQGVGGTVINLEGNQFNGNLVAHVYNNNFERRVPIASNSLYGTTDATGRNSGWEIQVSTTIDAQLYFVRLETQSGTQVSTEVQIQFPNNCEQNLAVVNFIQLRPLQ